MSTRSSKNTLEIPCKCDEAILKIIDDFKKFSTNLQEQIEAKWDARMENVCSQLFDMKQELEKERKANQAMKAQIEELKFNNEDARSAIQQVREIEDKKEQMDYKNDIQIVGTFEVQPDAGKIGEFVNAIVDKNLLNPQDIEKFHVKKIPKINL